MILQDAEQSDPFRPWLAVWQAGLPLAGRLACHWLAGGLLGLSLAG